MPHKITNYCTKNPSAGKFPLKSGDEQSLYKINPQAIFLTRIDLCDYDINNKNFSDIDTSSETEDSQFPEPLTSLFNPESIKLKLKVNFDTKTIKKHIPKMITTSYMKKQKSNP